MRYGYNKASIDSPLKLQPTQETTQRDGGNLSSRNPISPTVLGNEVAVMADLQSSGSAPKVVTFRIGARQYPVA